MNQAKFVYVTLIAASPERVWEALTTAEFTRQYWHSTRVQSDWRMSGDVDYLLKILVADIADYDRVYKKLIAATTLSDVSSSFAMERIKHTTKVPIP